MAALPPAVRAALVETRPTIFPSSLTASKANSPPHFSDSFRPTNFRPEKWLGRNSETTHCSAMCCAFVSAMMMGSNVRHHRRANAERSVAFARPSGWRGWAVSLCQPPAANSLQHLALNLSPVSSIVGHTVTKGTNCHNISYSIRTKLRNANNMMRFKVSLTSLGEKAKLATALAATSRNLKNLGTYFWIAVIRITGSDARDCLCADDWNCGRGRKNVFSCGVGKGGGSGKLWGVRLDD